MKKALVWLDNVEKYLLFVLLLAMTIIIGLQVFFRFILNSSLSWSEEIARYLLVWTTFIGASLGVKEGAHIGVEAVVMRLPENLKRITNIISVCLSIIFCAIVVIKSIEIIQIQLMVEQVSAAIQIPMWIPYLAIPVGITMMTIRFIQTIVKQEEGLETEKKSSAKQEGVRI